MNELSKKWKKHPSIPLNTEGVFEKTKHIALSFCDSRSFLAHLFNSKRGIVFLNIHAPTTRFKKGDFVAQLKGI